jgi:branched-chain amino acid transport system ATP-binding protein
MMLEIKGLNAGYGGVPVVWDIDLNVGEGEVVALLGPNGAGKTTILLTITQLIEPLGGTISIAGRPVGRTTTHRLARDGITLIPDDRGLIPSLTVKENLSLVRSAKRDPLEILPELVPLLNRDAGLLSGGEQQMLALARAFASEPKLLLIDELSQGLAPVLVERLLPRVRAAADEWGAGVVLVEQEVVNALRVADRGYVLSHGHMVVSDTPASELLSQREILQSAYLGDAAITEQA